MTDSATALPPDPFSTSLAGRRLGRYEVLARLASGGMAAVYVGRALGVAGFERLFAVKVLHPHLAHEEEFITMFLDEARLAARIRHPNVVPTIDISDTQDAGYFLVMDYIEGDHLGALLQKAYKLGTRLPAPVTLRIIVDALEGLAAAHHLTDESGRRINLVHRDVSPHNVMVSTDGIARITDFGVAKAEVRLSTTRQGQFKGKLAYMAPEQASTGEADQRSDLFSVAIILWECLTGRRLFRAENQAATLNKICIEPIPMPSSVDSGLAPFDEILARGLARDPADRFQTAEEFAEAIERHAEALGGLANQRSVAKLVREYASEKIERDRELIRTAIAEIGVASETEAGAYPQYPPSEPLPPAFAPSAARAPAPPLIAPPMAPPPIAMPEPVATWPEPSGRGRPVWLIAILVLVALGLVVAALSLGGEKPPVTTSPLAPTPAALQEPTPAPAPAVQPATGSEPATTTTTAAPASAPATAEGAAEAPTEPAAPTASSTSTKRPGTRRPTGDTRRATSGAAEAPSADKPKSKPKVDDVDLLLNPYRR